MNIYSKQYLKSKGFTILYVKDPFGEIKEKLYCLEYTNHKDKTFKTSIFTKYILYRTIYNLNKHIFHKIKGNMP